MLLHKVLDSNCFKSEPAFDIDSIGFELRSNQHSLRNGLAPQPVIRNEGCGKHPLKLSQPNAGQTSGRFTAQLSYKS